MSLEWKVMTGIKEFHEILKNSHNKPVMIFKYDPKSPECVAIKASLEANWVLNPDRMDLYLVDVYKSEAISKIVTKVADIPDEHPQVIMYAGGVAVYDESHEMINVKKIKIALKIVSRAFRWMETRV